MNRKTITFEQAKAQQSSTHPPPPPPAPEPVVEAFPTPEDGLHKERPELPRHPGQELPEEKKRQGTLRHGYERLVHMYSLGMPFKMEELQGRHPFDFVEETKEHFKLHPDPIKKPAQPEDTTLFDVREWLEPIIRKGQIYWDYCRDKWIDKESKLGSACAPISCMFSLWSITDSVLYNGGYVFMAVYLLVTVLFIIPFIYMELTLGQFHRQGLVKTMQQTCPLFQGVAYLMLVYSLFDYLLSATRISWLLYYFLSCGKDGYPWSHCDQDWNSAQCVEILDHDGPPLNVTRNRRTPAVDWYRIHVTRPWKHWELVYGKNPPLGQVIVGLLPHSLIFLCFLAFLFVCILQMKTWVRVLGRNMKIISFFAFMFIGTCTLSFDSFFSPDVHNPAYRWFFQKDHLKYFYDKNTWTSAIRHAVIGSGIGTGIYITFGSHNTFPHDEIKRMAVLSGLSSYGVHILLAFFFILCHFTILTTVSISSSNATVDYGYDIIFEQFPQVAVQHPNSGLAKVLFSTMIGGLILLATLRVLCSLHVLCQFFYDRDKEYYEPCRFNYQYWEHDKIKRHQRYANLHLTPQRKGQLITRLLLYASIFQVCTLLPGGSVMLFVVEEFWYNYVPMFIILFECVAVFFFAGVRTLNEYVRRMTTWQVTLWYRFVWRTFIPLVPVLYFTHPPREIRRFGGIKLPELVKFIGYACAGLPFFYMYMSILHVWRKSRAKTFCKKFLLEVTPQHEHDGIIAGRKPSTRLHWMHHLHVPAGVSRGPCFPPMELPPRKPDPNRYDSDNFWMDFFWNTLRLRIFNKMCGGCVSYPSEEEMMFRHFHMFPPIPLQIKPPKKQKPFPEFLPNQSIKRVYKLKKYNEFHGQRRHWLGEKVELETERMAAEHDERDIETGIMAHSTAAKEAKDEDEEKEFFDTFNMSDEENAEETPTSESTLDSFDPSSEDAKGKLSSPSVSTSDSFDSQNSLFFGSGEDDHLFKYARHTFDSDSGGDEDADDDIEEDLEGYEDPYEIIAPAMDFDEDAGVRFDDETDSWDLEDLEDLEDARAPLDEDEEDTFTSEDETDTDELVQNLEDSKEESDSSTTSTDSDEWAEIEEGVPAAAAERAAAKTEADGMKKKSDDKHEDDSEETNSWSLSCGSSSTCSSEETDDDDDDSSEDSSDNSEDERRPTVSSLRDSEVDDPAIRRKYEKDNQLKFYRNIAEKLDTFLHYSKKKEKERLEFIHEQRERAKQDEKTREEQEKREATHTVRSTENK